jgi:hypothetical protein
MKRLEQIPDVDAVPSGVATLEMHDMRMGLSR